MNFCEHILLQNTIRLWVRDDDAVEDAPALRRLFGLKIPIALAVIPAKLHQNLIPVVKDNPHITVIQHGWQHINHAANGLKKSEYPASRHPDAVTAEIALGKRILEDAFDSQFLPLFAPPWNRLDVSHLDAPPAAGLPFLSTHGTPKTSEDSPAHLDILRWHPKPPVFTGEDFLIREWQNALSKGAHTVGLLTHHLEHDAAAWDFLENTVRTLPSHRWCSITEVLNPPAYKPSIV